MGSIKVEHKTKDICNYPEWKRQVLAVEGYTVKWRHVFSCLRWNILDYISVVMRKIRTKKFLLVYPCKSGTWNKHITVPPLSSVFKWNVLHGLCEKGSANELPLQLPRYMWAWTGSGLAHHPLSPLKIVGVLGVCRVEYDWFYSCFLCSFRERLLFILPI